MRYQNFKRLLSEYLSFKSISTDKAFLPEIQKQVDWLSNLFSKNGFEVEILKGRECNPVIFASHKTSKSAETILVYGHYDVQPANKEDGWGSDPFSLYEKSGKLTGRGVVDNKGQNLIHIYTVINLIKEKKLAYNVKFMIEGNEEAPSAEILKIVKEYRKKLACDYVVISDGEIPYKPAIDYSLRGGFNVTLKYKTASNNVHSGIFGGAIPNAAYELTNFISKLYDKDNKIAVPGFYDNVDIITKKQVRNNRKLLENPQEIYKLTGVKALKTEKGIDFYTQTGLRPTIQITGFKAGYIGDGYSNIVPAVAEARINFRIVTSQNPKDVLKTFEKFVKKNTPKYVDWKVDVSGPHNPIKIDTGSKKFEEAKKVLKEAFGDDVLVKPVGGAIPIVSDFKEILGVDTLLISLGNDDCNMHGANENFDTGLLEKGLKFSRLFFQRVQGGAL